MDAPLGPPPPYDLTNPQTVRAVEAEHRLRARKQFSQHWLVDRDRLELLVAEAQLSRASTVVEVGAGMGVLTAELARRAGRVIAVELERAVIPALRRTVRRYENVEILEMDLLKFDPTEQVGTTPYQLVANLPYAITGLTLRHFLEVAHPPTRMVLMVQWEVAERLAASPGEMSLLSVSTQLYATPQIVTKVPANSFLPPPEVDSAIIRLDIHPPLVTGEVRDRLLTIAKIAFSQRRKQLHNIFPMGMHISTNQTRLWLSGADIAPDRRPQTLSLAEWIRLAEVDPHDLPA